jgi:hypothetical protein
MWRHPWLLTANYRARVEPTLLQPGRASPRSKKLPHSIGALGLGIVVAAGLSACGEKPILLTSDPSKPVLSFAVPSDGSYRVDYDLRGCAGTTISVWNTTVGGVDLSRPNETTVVTAKQSRQTGSTKVSLNYGTWQVDDTKGKPAGCNWKMTVTPVLF